MARSKLTVRRNGVHFTPDALADVLACGAIHEPQVSVLDPACGDGALLAAADGRCHSLAGASAPDLVGCDKLAQRALRKLRVPWRPVKSDFFAYKPSREFDVILMNPPFVSARMLGKAKRTLYQRRHASFCGLSGNADLWAYFLVKALSHLREGGTVGAILPWSFLQADYAGSLRARLREMFASVRVLVITSQCFDHTNQRVLLLWLQGFGTAAEKLSIGFSDQVGQDPSFHSVSQATWDSGALLAADEGNTLELLGAYFDAYGFSPLSDHADVHIGVVTGANDFFVTTEPEARSHGFRSTNLLPVLTSSGDIHSLRADGSCGPKRLLRICRDAESTCSEYIARGVAAEYHLRSQCRRRDPWYEVDTGDVPDAFFTYRVAAVPILALNDSGLQCTNAVHRVYFRDLTEAQRRWVQVSLLAAPARLSLEVLAKTYGNGALKVEPNALKRSPVYVPDAPFPADAYARLNRLVENGEREAASALATKVVNLGAGVARDLALRTTAALDTVRSRRCRGPGDG